MVLVGAALVLTGGAAACGSSSTVGTTGGATGTTAPSAGPLVATLSTDCANFQGTSMSEAATPGAATAAAAVKVFLVGPDTVAAQVRHQSFEPALPPAAAGPVQSVGSSSAPAGAVSTTATSPTSSTSATAADASAWFAHRQPDGQVTGVIHVDQGPSGWKVDELQICTTGSGSSGDSTATTGSEPGALVPVNSPTTVGAYPVPDTLGPPPSTASSGSLPSVSTTVFPYTTTTVMGGP